MRFQFAYFKNSFPNSLKTSSRSKSGASPGALLFWTLLGAMFFRQKYRDGRPGSGFKFNQQVSGIGTARLWAKYERIASKKYVFVFRQLQGKRCSERILKINFIPFRTRLN